MVTAPSVTADQLTKSFRGVEAVSGITFEVLRGEVFGLVGPDGAGKTTTMRMLAAILSPDSGSLSILGLDPLTDRGRIHERTAYMSQRFGLYHDLSVMENIRFYADMYGGQTPAAGRLLEWSGLAPFKDRPAGKLSGGMKQHLGLACALVHTPELLLMDEPTNGVDPVSRREFWSLLYELVEDGLSIVLTTSYLDEAERCHRLAFLDNGKITAAGTPGEIAALITGGVLSFASHAPFEESKAVSSLTGAVSTVVGSSVHVMGEITEETVSRCLGREISASRTAGTVEDAFVFLSAGSSD